MLDIFVSIITFLFCVFVLAIIVVIFVKTGNIAQELKEIKDILKESKKQAADIKKAFIREVDSDYIKMIYRVCYVKSKIT